MSPSRHARLQRRTVVDHHDVLYLVRHHHATVNAGADALILFVLDTQHRLFLAFVIHGFPRQQLDAIDRVNEVLAALTDHDEATSLIVCWCTDDLVTPEAAEDQLALLGGLRMGALFAGLHLRDVYWIHPFGFESLADRATQWCAEQ